MKDYAQIITRIGQTPWLITPEGLSMVLGIVQKHISGEMTDEEIAASANLRSSDSGRGDRQLQSYKGLGILPISGPIFGKANLMTQMSGATSLEMFQKDFAEMVNDDGINAILLQIDSPGGTDQLVQETGEQIFSARQQKPIYAIADTMIGSAALWLACQANEIYSTPSGSVGSLGAYTVHEDQSAADAQQGRKFTYISAGPHKVEGNPHEPLSPEAKAHRQETIDELYEGFVSAVATGRNLSVEKVKSDFGGGRMLTPSKALDAGMIDGITSMDNLVGHLVSQPRKVSVAIGGGKRVTGIIEGNNLSFLDSSLIDKEALKAYLESKEWEHSEPGTGPAPRTDEDGSDDRAIKGGWRRDPLPLDPADPTAPKPPGGMNNMEGEQLTELAKLLGLPEASTFEQVMASATTQFGELATFRSAVNASNEEKEFAERYPDIYREHMENREAVINTKASSFCDSVKSLTRVEGEKQVNTKFALSALAMENITDVHKKFAMGTVTLSDFENAITTIMHGGVLDYGEKGSAVPKEDGIELPDTSTKKGVQQARQLFADKVSEIQMADGLDWNAALKLAGEKYPDLAEIYVNAISQG